MKRRVVVALTGASGSIYAERLLAELVNKVERIYFIASESGEAVARHEIQSNKEKKLNLLSILDGKLSYEEKKVIRLLKNSDLFAPIASGSSSPTDMVVIPASMGTVARIAHGLSSCLIERSADVCFKEKRRMIILPRETPFNTIHLENLLKLSQLGAHIIPAMPAFYNHPKSIDEMIDFVVGRVLDAMGIEHDLYRRWNPRMV